MSHGKVADGPAENGASGPLARRAPVSRGRSGVARLSVRAAGTGDTLQMQARPKYDVRKVNGFGPMARITTSFGEVYAQALRKGDMVRTPMGQFTRIEHIDRLRMDEAFMAAHPDAMPIRIRKGSLGPGLPTQDVTVAPYQMVRPGAPRSAIPMVPAVELLGKPFVCRATDTNVTYTRLYFTRATSGFCEGLATDF